MKLTQDFLLLSFYRAGPEAVRNAVLGLAGFAAAIGLALVVVLALAPPRLPDLGPDGPVGSVNRVGKIVYGPGPNDLHCRGFQFDNRTAVLEQTGEADCAAILGKRPQLDGAHLGTVRDSFRR